MKREGRKIPDVINGATGSFTKGKARAGPFEEDSDLGSRKIQSWVPDEEEPSGSHGQFWEDSQAYANPMSEYRQSSQGFQQGRIPFQQQNKGNVFQQKQLGAPNGLPPQIALASQNKPPSPFAPNASQQKTPAFVGTQQGVPQQLPSAFQQAISSFSKPPVSAFSKPSSSTSIFNPAASAFKPTAPAFQQVAPTFVKPTTGPFSQTAPAFSGGVNASAASLSSGSSAKFGQSSAPISESTPLHKLPADSHLINNAPSPTPAPNQQSHTPSQGFGYNDSGDQSGAAWQQEGDWGQEGYYQGEGGEEGYYEELAGGGGDEDDEYTMRQADIVRRQGEVAQMKAQVDAQLEEAKRMLAEKEAVAQQRKKDKKQSELRQRLLNHNFAQNVAQQGIQQHQKSVSDLPPQQPPAATPLFSFSKPAEESSSPKGASSAFLQSFKIPQLSLSLGLENRISFDLEKAADDERRRNASGAKPNTPPALEPRPEREPSPEPSPPQQDPAVLLEQFSLYVNARMRDVVQAANPMARNKVLDELRADLQDALDTQPGLEECCNILATAFYRGNISYAAFTFWRKCTAAKVRKARMAVLRAEKRRLLAEREKGLGTIEEQWVPVKIKIRPGDNLVRQGDLFRDFNFHELPLDDIFANPLQKAFMSRGIIRTNFSLICVNAEPKAEYWWLRKFGISSRVGIGVLPRQKKLANENTFAVERVLREPEPPTDVGALIFGCRADWSVDNGERFEADKKDLHAVVEYALRSCRYEKIAVMVICYRSPLDKRDADPYGEEVDRTEGEGRKNRLKLIRRALGLNALPKERVITKDIVLLETLQDLNMISAVKRFAKSAAGVVGREGLGKKKEEKVIPSVESAMALMPYEEVVTDREEDLRNRQHRRPTKRKISISSPVGGPHNANIFTNGISKTKKRASISPPRLNGTFSTTRKLPTTNGIILTKHTLSTPGSEYFKLKSHGIYVSPPPITNTTTASSTTATPIPLSNHHVSSVTSSSLDSQHRGYPLPLLPRSSASAAAFKKKVIKSTPLNSQSQPQASRKRTRALDSISNYQLGDYRSSSPPKRHASEEREERERREMEEHDKRTSAIRAALYDFENDPVVVEARRIREAPEYHPELEWPELVMGGL
ncbi:hypothetical protein EV426DRAFT_280912 [Tirmania nivea]|nr:hypothetical protein EV426DRAFT_280912 [Tirmania nivea]